MRLSNLFRQKMSYLVVITGIPTLGGLIVAITTVSELKLSTLASQGVDATLEVDIQSRAVVDGQRLLCRNIGVRGVRRIPQALLINFQEAREINGRFGNKNLTQQRTIHAVLRAANVNKNDNDDISQF